MDDCDLSGPDAEEAAKAAADLLGIEISGWLGSGDEGEVWRLADGRVMKLTCSQQEAASWLAVASHGTDIHPGVARVYAVHRLDMEIEVGAFAGAGPVWLIIRDDMDPEPVSELGGVWEDLLLKLNIACRAETPEELRDLDTIIGELQQVARHRSLARPFGKLISSLRWLREKAEVHFVDVQPHNFGVSASGAIGPFDLGHCRVPERWMSRAAGEHPLEISAAFSSPDARQAI